MNDHHDDNLDPLLAEVLGPDEPRPQLVDEICELTDARLTDALEQAIGPHTVECDHDELVRRILAATSERPAVIARIGFARPLRTVLRFAAMVALVAGAYLVITAVMTPTTPEQPIARGPENTVNSSVSAIDAMELEFASLASDDTSSFDQRIALVSAGVDQIGTDAVWADSPDALVDRAAETTGWYDSGNTPATSTWF